MSFGIIVFWLLCGVASAMVASSKGRDAFGWFLIGALFGPIGLVISLVSRKNEGAIEDKSISSGNYKKCPYCAELIKSEAVICKHCSRQQDLPAIKSNNKDEDFNRRLQSAIASNDVQAVTSILDEGHNINESDLPMSHIEYAELHGNKEIIELIRERG